ncbi:MAG TPA: hypothetical protein VN783_16210, partial [Thermoanaerobaculia bacterium]|nr:hypothetical protein [Thermoanaerobaculia bacterium]
MSATGQTLAERMSRWDTLISNLEPALADLPHLTGEAAQLKTMIDQVRDLAHRQDALRAQAQENTAALNALALQADKLRYRIGAGIR